MSELRQDATTGDWVIIAPERGRRPLDAAGRPGTTGARAAFDPDCPFCPGNERLLLGIVAEIPDGDPPGWRVRVVPNRYPAVSPAVGAASPEPSGAVAPAGGRHEVIVESPRHDADLAHLAGADLAAVLLSYRERYRALLAQPDIRSVVLFRNSGGRAGASLPHPHSQAIALAATPPREAALLAWARGRYEQSGHCPTCRQISIDIQDGRRIVEATERFLAVVPFAAASPFELRLLPRRHQADFGEIEDGVLPEFGALLQRLLRRLDALLGDPPYNFAVESAADPAEAAWAHWRLRLVPRLVTPGGFELASGLPINPSLPEADAEALRAALPG